MTIIAEKAKNKKGSYVYRGMVEILDKGTRTALTETSI